MRTSMRKTACIIAAFLIGGCILNGQAQQGTPQQPVKQKLVHKKVSIKEYEDLLRHIHELYGVGSFSYSSTLDSMEIVPETIARYIESKELFYNYVNGNIKDSLGNRPKDIFVNFE